MNNIQVIKGLLANKQDQFIETILGELEKGDNKVGAKELASTIKYLLSAKTVNNAGIEMNDNKTILDTVKLVLQLNGIKIGNSININLFNVNKPRKDSYLEY